MPEFGSKIFLKYFLLTQQIPLSIIGVGAQVPCLRLELEIHLEHVDHDKHDGDVELEVHLEHVDDDKHDGDVELRDSP